MRKIAVKRESGCCKPRYRRLRDVERPCHVCLCFPIRKALKSFCPLVRRESSRPPKLDAPSLSAFAAFACAVTNQFSLKLGQTTEDGEHQPAMWRCGVCPCVLDTAEAGFTLADGGQHIEQVAG